MGETANKSGSHKLIVDNRNSMSMTGVMKVISIDTDLVLLVTDQGKLKITGKNMQASTLDIDKGILELTGNFNALVYSGDKEGYVLCLAVGAVFGVVGIIFRMLRRLFKSGRIITWVCDIMLWLALSVAIIVLNYICCDGRIRLYIFLGFFSGFLISFYTINWVVSKIANYILYQKNKG